MNNLTSITRRYMISSLSQALLALLSTVGLAQQPAAQQTGYVPRTSGSLIFQTIHDATAQLALIKEPGIVSLDSSESLTQLSSQQLKRFPKETLTDLFQLTESIREQLYQLQIITTLKTPQAIYTHFAAEFHKALQEKGKLSEETSAYEILGIVPELRDNQDALQEAFQTILQHREVPESIRQAHYVLRNTLSRTVYDCITAYKKTNQDSTKLETIFAPLILSKEERESETITNFDSKLEGIIMLKNNIETVLRGKN